MLHTPPRTKFHSRSSAFAEVLKSRMRQVLAFFLLFAGAAPRFFYFCRLKGFSFRWRSRGRSYLAPGFGHLLVLPSRRWSMRRL